MLNQEVEAAVATAREAGKVILDHYATEFLTEQKLGYDNFYEPVTVADRDASKIIVKGLTAAFPEDAILSEEEADDLETRMAARRVWIIDPIDGTAGFVGRDDDFGVQIGMIEDGVPTVGVVYMPAYDILMYAAKGRGAFIENRGGTAKRLATSTKTDTSQLVAAASRHHPSKRMKRIRQAFGFKRSIERGSVGVKAGLIAQGECDIYLSPGRRTKLWDTCGPQVILEEAGGRFTDLFGDPLQYARRGLQNYNGILATNGAAHDAIVKKLRPLLREFGRVREPYD
jgi:3'(2'), 5'-bisphosphate nucleotidase